MTNKRDVNVETGKQGFQERERTEATTPSGSLRAAQLWPAEIADDGGDFADWMGRETGFNEALFTVTQDVGRPIVRVLSLEDVAGLSAKDPFFDSDALPLHGQTVEDYLVNNVPDSTLSHLANALPGRELRWRVSPEGRTGLTAYDPVNGQKYTYGMDEGGGYGLTPDFTVARPNMINDPKLFAAALAEDTGYDSVTFEIDRQTKVTGYDSDKFEMVQEHGTPVINLLHFRDTNGNSTATDDIDEIVMDHDGAALETSLEANISAQDLEALVNAKHSHADMEWTISPEKGLSAYDPTDDQDYAVKVTDGKPELLIESH
jgi:hypothetical protein